MGKCSNCGSDYSDGAKFCPACGQQIQLAERSPDDPLLGSVMDNKFRIEQLLGVGGMGRVYKATQLILDKTVCVKVLRPGLMQDETLVQRFHSEARAASRLNHPNSISVIDFGQAKEDRSLYIAMEYVPGRDLGKLICEEWPLSPERIVNIMDQVLSALADAHAAGIVHRDLKPENIMVADLRGTKDFVKVLDFGIAKIQESSTSGSRLTQVGMVCGTPEYMSPEQARGESLDARSDVYAAGVVLYQMVVGRIPFEAPTAMGIVTKHLTESPIPPGQIEGVKVPDGLEAVVLKALSKDPAGRQPTALALQQELNQALSRKIPYAQRTPLGNVLFEEQEPETTGIEYQADRDTAVAQPVKETASRSRSLIVWLVPIAVIIVGGLIGVWLWFSAQEQAPVDESVSGEAVVDRQDGSLEKSPEASTVGGKTDESSSTRKEDLPESAKIHYHAGKELMVQNKLVRAVEEFKKAVKKVPGFAAAHKAVATAYMRLGRVKKAKQHFRLYLLSAPDSEDRKDIQELIDSL